MELTTVEILEFVSVVVRSPTGEQFIESTSNSELELSAISIENTSIEFQLNRPSRNDTIREHKARIRKILRHPLYRHIKSNSGKYKINLMEEQEYTI